MSNVCIVRSQPDQYSYTIDIMGKPCKEGATWRVCSTREPFRGEDFAYPYSHSIVPGGLLVTSYTTLFTPFTSLMIRVAVSPRNFMSKG